MGTGSSVAGRWKMRRQRRTEDASLAAMQSLRSRRNWEINKLLEEERKAMRKTVKLLLLGASESGKSTFAKQIRLIHHGGFTDSERLVYKDVIISNLISGMTSILDAMSTLDISYSDPKRQMDEMLFRSCFAFLMEQGTLDMTTCLADAITDLWRDPGVQQCYDRSHEYQLLDSTSYYIENVYRLADPAWVPTDDDIVRSRLQTTGIIETRFQFRGLTFRLVDVGGQRSERKKWIHCFDDVTAILFTVAISAYSQTLKEDCKTSRMEESMRLFESICNSKWFSKTAMVLFLNKCDLFEERLVKIPLKHFFASYDGPNEVKPARSYICSLFKKLSRVKNREVYHHFTTAVSRTNVQFVFDAVSNVILKDSLGAIGMF